MGTGEFNAEGNPAIDLHPFQGGVEIPQKSEISAGLMGHLAQMQTLPFFTFGSCIWPETQGFENGFLIGYQNTSHCIIVNLGRSPCG